MNRIILLVILVMTTSYGFSQDTGVDSISIEENAIVEFYLQKFKSTFDENIRLKTELSDKDSER